MLIDTSSRRLAMRAISLRICTGFTFMVSWRAEVFASSNARASATSSTTSARFAPSFKGRRTSMFAGASGAWSNS